MRLLHLHSSFSPGGKELRAAKLMNAFGGAMEHTIVVSASASEPAPLQYLAPYAGAALGVMAGVVHALGEALEVLDQALHHALRAALAEAEVGALGVADVAEIADRRIHAPSLAERP